jgi:Zn-dependent protease with chaperone function
MLAAVLAATSVLLAGPISGVLARARWTRRAPRGALVLWQAVCLSAGICLVGAGFTVALAPYGPNMATAGWAWLGDLIRGHPLARMTGPGIMAGTLAAAAALILFGVLIRSVVLAVRRRHAHRMVLDLLTGHRAVDAAARDAAARDAAARDAAARDAAARDAAARPEGDTGPCAVPRAAAARVVDELLADVRILDHPTAVAYTLPGWHSRVVLSAGMLNLLARAELVAVIDHERAHVRSRHDLLVLPFQAWATALGWLPGVRAAAAAVAELTEMLADDWAGRRSSPSILARALATVALAGVPADSGVVGYQTPAVAGRSVAARVMRLLHPDPLPFLQLAWAHLAAALLVALPVGVLLLGWR